MKPVLRLASSLVLSILTDCTTTVMQLKDILRVAILSNALIIYFCIIIHRLVIFTSGKIISIK